MIEICDEDFPNGYIRHAGLSDAESRELDCEYWSETRQELHECMGFGHYLCYDCASLSPDSPMITQYLDDAEIEARLDDVEGP